MFGSSVNTQSGIFPEDSPFLTNSVIQCFVLRNTNSPPSSEEGVPCHSSRRAFLKQWW